MWKNKRTTPMSRASLLTERYPYKKMNAETALDQSEGKMIVADTPRGLVTILQGVIGRTSGTFHLGFIPRDHAGLLRTSETITIGSYEDLDTALTIAAVSYGPGETAWMPANEFTSSSGIDDQSDLRKTYQAKDR
jgi:hypothetical protein